MTCRAECLQQDLFGARTVEEARRIYDSFVDVLQHEHERFSLVLRAGRDSGRAKAGRKRCLHKGRRYCSDTCRKLASKARHWSQSSPEISSERPERAATFSTVTSAPNTVEISRGYKRAKSGRAGLQMTFGDYAVVPDP